jgi:hypothetical protein
VIWMDCCLLRVISSNVKTNRHSSLDRNTP